MSPDLSAPGWAVKRRRKGLYRDGFTSESGEYYSGEVYLNGNTELLNHTYIYI